MRLFVAALASMFAIVGCGEIPSAQNVATGATGTGFQNLTRLATIEVPFASALQAFDVEHADAPLKGIKIWFRDYWGATTSFGRALVAIPPEHKRGDPTGLTIDVEGRRISTQFIERLQSGLLRIESLESVSREYFASVVAAGKPREVVILIHGYNTSPENAIYRAAQLKADTGYSDPIVAFIWPSDSTDGIFGYVAAKNGVMAAQARLVDVLKILAADDHIKRIHILAHSMGALLAVQALSEYAKENRNAAEMKIAEIVLAAPALPITIYRERLSVVRGMISGGMTVYASRHDKPLWLGSDMVDRDRLIGYILNSRLGPVAVSGDSTEFIDASNGTTESGIESNFLKHSIFLEDEGLRADIVSIFEAASTGSRKTPDSRKNMRRVTRRDGTSYWVYERRQ